MGDFMNKEHLENYKQLGLNIRYYRIRKEYTQMQLAEIIDVDITHISKIELWKVGASLDVVFEIAKALEVPVHKLFEPKD
jgi:DNA-binding XRE family transcriptional regulator